MESQKCGFGEGEAWQRPVDPYKSCPLSRGSPSDLPRICTRRGAPSLALLSGTDIVACRGGSHRIGLPDLRAFLFPRCANRKRPYSGGQRLLSPATSPCLPTI